MDSNSEGNAEYQEAQFFDGLDGQMGGDMGGGAEGELFAGDYEQMSPLREQDRFLPIANVSKIMKKPIPETGKIAKEAKECVQECVSEFISFITSEAAERCQQEKRKTINGEDILYAMSTLGFDTYVDPLKGFLTKYREAMKIDLAAIESDSCIDADYVHYGTVSGGAGSDAGSVAEPATGNGGTLQTATVTNQSQQGQVGSTTVYYTTTPQVLTVNGSQLSSIGQIPNNAL